jgi:serine phosphatase RsbU (regulator of sigma subunit)/HAMP domain-containing protein/preprotein translocase subunit YajC
MRLSLEKLKISLKLKITFVLLLLVIVMMTTVGYIFTVREQNLRVEQVKERMERLARNIATIRSVETEDWDVYQNYIDNQIKVNPDIVYIAIFDERGELKVNSLNSDWLALDSQRPLTNYEQANIVLRLDQRQVAAESQKDIESQSVNIIIGDRNLGTVNIGFSLVDLNDEMKSNLYRNLLLDAFFIFLAIIFSFIISSRIVIPLGKLTKAMEKISRGDFNQKLFISSRDEIGEMAKTFNFMANELQEKQVFENFSHELAFTIELEKISSLITERIAQALNSKQAYFFLKENEQASQFDLVAAYPQKMNEKVTLAKNQQLCELAIRSRKPLSQKDFETHPELLSLLGKLDAINENALICPLIIKDKVPGILILGESNQNKPYSESEISFLNILLAQGSVAIENALLYVELTEQERLKHELGIARNVQLNLLPQKNPQISGLDIDGICIPAAEVGGDYFDYFVLDNQTLGIVVADVTGKGTSAAFYMAVVKGIMLSLTSIYSSPGQLLKELNRRLLGIMDRKVFITMIYATVDVHKKVLKFARAGHNALIMRNSKNSKIECLTPKGIGLGLAHDSLFDQHISEETINFQTGDTFLFYTDGISEAMNEQLDEFGEQRLVEIVAQLKDGNAQQLREGIIQAIDQFVQKAAQHDDITLVTLKAT